MSDFPELWWSESTGTLYRRNFFHPHKWVAVMSRESVPLAQRGQLPEDAQRVQNPNPPEGQMHVTIPKPAPDVTTVIAEYPNPAWIDFRSGLAAVTAADPKSGDPRAYEPARGKLICMYKTTEDPGV